MPESEPFYSCIREKLVLSGEAVLKDSWTVWANQPNHKIQQNQDFSNPALSDRSRLDKGKAFLETQEGFLQQFVGSD